MVVKIGMGSMRIFPLLVMICVAPINCINLDQLDDMVQNDIESVSFIYLMRARPSRQ